MADPRFLLDSNILIYLLKGVAPTLRERVEACAPGEIVTSAIVHAEVMRGLDGAASQAVQRLLAIIPVMPFDAKAALAYASLPFRRGRFDRLIAAHSLSLGLVLVTNNVDDFNDVPALVVENWTL